MAYCIAEKVVGTMNDLSPATGLAQVSKECVKGYHNLCKNISTAFQQPATDCDGGSPGHADELNAAQTYPFVVRPIIGKRIVPGNQQEQPVSKLLAAIFEFATMVCSQRWFTFNGGSIHGWCKALRLVTLYNSK